MKYLEKLARIFQNNGKRIYVVGSFVRHIVCGDPCFDVDICGACLPSEVEEILQYSEFEVCDVKLNLFYAHIRVKNKPSVCFDYTSFRKDFYAKDGGHQPTRVTRAKTIKEDYIRRDFTINAIYFDPLINEYYDYCGGLDNLNHRLLKTIKNPNECFASDALRIVRMVRFAVDGPFNIEYNTFQAAKSNAKKIINITETKFNKELNKIKNKELGFKLLKEIFPWKEF